MTRVTYEQFRDEISSQIRRVSGQEEDPGFVVTLRNYVLGLVKHHGTAEPAAMQKKLKEFLEENTTSFVTWCVLDVHGLAAVGRVCLPMHACTASETPCGTHLSRATRAGCATTCERTTW